MNFLKTLTNQELLSRTEFISKEVHRITLELLWCLREVERRRLYATLGYASLHEYVVRHLRFSEDAAHRRISSMRLLMELPEAESMIKSGELSLSTATGPSHEGTWQHR